MILISRLHTPRSRTVTAAIVWFVFVITAFGAAGATAVEVPDSAHGVGAVEGDDPRVESRLLFDHSAAGDGDTIRVGVLFDIDPDWHIYWRNSGEAGLSTSIKFSSGAATFGELRWPAPHVYVDQSGEVATFGYADQTLLFTTATVTETSADSIEVEAVVDYLACKVDCIPGRSTLRRSLQIGDAVPDDRTTDLFDRYDSRRPISARRAGLEMRVEFSSALLRPGETIDAVVELRSDAHDLSVEAPTKRYAFIPDLTQNVTWKTRTVDASPKPDVVRMEVRGTAGPDAFDDPCELAGVVHVSADGAEPTPVYISHPIDCSDAPRADSGKESSAMPGATSETPAKTPSSPAAPALPWWQILLMALLGGVLLNLMPCVFPVLAVKVFALVRLAHEERHTVLSHSGAYAGGILASMLTLAAVVVGLRAGGTAVGWGFQFQEPLYIAVLGAALVLFAANLFGVFDVTVSAGKLADVTQEAFTLRRSFGEGVLAVVLATPCSAPFLGTAVGFALTSSVLMIFAVFAALGVGLALPFVILTASPKLTRWLPKPGDWMVKMKHALGFALLAVVVWLVWILGQSTGNDGVLRLLAFLLSVALAAWIWGAVQYSSKTWRRIGALLSIAVILGTGAVALDFREATTRSAPEHEETLNETTWRTWSEEAVQAELSEGRPVFVDFTADWCITCKVNERNTLADDEVLAAFRDADVVLFKADWTRRDEKIRRVLARHGKAGVPMYLLYSPEEPDDPEVLPELLTVTTVVEALNSL